MKEEEHLGQENTESVTAKLQTGMAKKRTINTIMIHCDNLFFIFSFPSFFGGF
jgi:hypothetical protein